MGEEVEQVDAGADIELLEEDGDEVAGFFVTAGDAGGAEGVVAGLEVQLEGGVSLEAGGILEADETTAHAEVDDGAGLMGVAIDLSEGDAAGAGVARVFPSLSR